MHLACIGMCKKLFDLTFRTKSVGPRLARLKEPLLEAIKNLKLPLPFARRERQDFIHFKSADWRSMATLYFPLMLHLLPPEPDQRFRELWALFGFSMRAHLADDKEFHRIEDELAKDGCSLTQINQLFYKLFQDLFGKEVCSYNVHIWGVHFNRMRRVRSLTESSAFPFESFYGDLLKKFCPGTPSTEKQILLNMLLTARCRVHNRCQHRLSHSAYETAIKQNNVVVTKRGDFYILEKNNNAEHTSFQARRVILEDYMPQRCPVVVSRWNLVGIYRYGGREDGLVCLEEADIATKAIIVGDTIMSVPVGNITEH
jgi:hypothetical protein